jgi:hypothetical protein
MKKAIVIIVLLALLFGGAVAGMAMLGIGPFAALAGKKVAEKEKVEAPPAEEAGPHTLTYEIGSFIVPLIENHGIARQVGMDLSVEVEGKDASRISQEIPKLQNAFTFELYDFVPHHSDAHSAADKQAIHDRLLKVANKLFGEGSVREVNIKSIYER